VEKPGKLRIKTNDSQETFKLGQKLAPLLRGKEVIFLEGELGGGKTTFAQGVARGLGVKEPLRSASFVILWETESGRLPLYHLDLYRLSPEELDELGLEDYLYGSGVTLVEWAEKLSNFPLEFLHLKFFFGENLNQRVIEVSWRGKEWEKKVKKWLKK